MQFNYTVDLTTYIKLYALTILFYSSSSKAYLIKLIKKKIGAAKLIRMRAYISKTAKSFTKEKLALLSKFPLKSMHGCKTMEILWIEIQLPIKLKTFTCPY